MHALRYFFLEAGASLWRGRRAASLSILTIGAGLFVLGIFLLLCLINGVLFGGIMWLVIKLGWDPWDTTRDK